jgi:hypothetical protein
MPWYRCLVRGENFPDLENEGDTIGFYTTRWVEAASAADAKNAAAELIRRDTTLESADDAKLYVEEVQETGRRHKPGSGYSFFTGPDVAPQALRIERGANWPPPRRKTR